MSHRDISPRTASECPGSRPGSDQRPAARPEGTGHRPVDLPASGPAHRALPYGGRTATVFGERPRIAALDVVRGFALCGILVANVKPIAHVGDAAIALPADPQGAGGFGSVDDWLMLIVDQRFFPIFSLLFGIGFSLLLESASDRADRPRLILLRRLLVLLALGLAHMFLLWRGDVLTIYAAVGLVVLLPSTWLPRWAVTGLAAALMAVGLIFFGGGFSLVPGLFLLGSALTRYGVTARMGRSTRGPAVIGLLLAAAAAPALWTQAHFQHAGDSSAFRISYPLAGSLVAGVYVCALLVLLRTPVRSALQAVFAPLGRMALTNYLSATALVLTAGRLLGESDGWSTTTVFQIAGVILAVQWLWSTLWLRRYRQGPLEWLWRWATWARRPPLRNAS